MSERYASDFGIEWKCADVRDLPEATGSIDVAFDKGTLDAMIFGSPWSPPEAVMVNSKKYIDQASFAKIFENPISQFIFESSGLSLTD